VLRSANIKHLVSTGNLDDYLDWTSGWVGAVQYAVLQQYALSGIDNGLEGDGKENAVTSTPYSNPYLANFTVVGAYNTSKFMNGANLRRGTKVTFVNSIFTGFNTAFRETDPTGSAYADGSGSGVVFQGVLAQAKNLGWNELLTNGNAGALSVVPTPGSYNGFAYPVTATNSGTSFTETVGNGNKFEAYTTLTGSVTTTASVVTAVAYTTAVPTNDLSAFLATLASNKWSMTVVPASLSGVTAKTVAASVNGATLDQTTYVGAETPGTANASAWYYGWTTTAAN